MALLFSTQSPVGNVGVQLLGAGLLGLAVALTSVPFLWLLVYGRNRRIAFRGDWVRAARRGIWVGLVTALFVVLRAQAAFTLPLALFVIVMVALVELTLTVER